MTHKTKLWIFVPTVLLGLYLQTGLAIRCRCAWGYWSLHFVDGALALDLFLLAHIVFRLIRRKFFDDCLWVAAIIITSCFWIPLIYKGVAAIYLLYTEGRVGELGH
jgi:hypothetical protein